MKRYTVGLTVEVPEDLVRWVMRRLRVSDAQARVRIRRALRVHAELMMKSAEILDEGGEDPLLNFVVNWQRAPKEGERWFDCGTGRARRMVNGQVKEDDDGEGE